MRSNFDVTFAKTSVISWMLLTSSFRLMSLVAGYLALRSSNVLGFLAVAATMSPFCQLGHRLSETGRGTGDYKGE